MENTYKKMFKHCEQGLKSVGIPLKRAFLLLVLVFTSYSSLAQQSIISGQVTDSKTKDVLPGTSIMIKGTTEGTTTDLEGNYKLEAPEDAILVFSFIGYRNMEVPVNGRSVIDVRLEEDIEQLGEVVVVGYGTQEAEDVTGAIATVSPEEFNKGIITSPDNLISGKVAGVVVSPSTELGGGANIRIRGASSINASSDPLIVVDGVPIDNRGFAGGRNGLNFINPNDIESVTVLKDASATAIYGSRAANGVIIYTTKSGTKGKPKFSYSGSYASSQYFGDNPFLSAANYRAVIDLKAPQRLDELGEASTNWSEEVIQAVESQSHEISVSGGSENTSYYFSLSHMDNKGVLRTSSNKITRTSVKLSTQLLDDNLKIVFTNKNAFTNDVFAPNVLGAAYTFDPTRPVRAEGYEEFGGFYEWGNPNATGNPVSILLQTKDVGQTFRSFGNIDLTYKIPVVDGLSVQSVTGYDVNNGRNEVFRPTTLRNPTQDGFISLSRSNRRNFLSDNYLRYENSLARLNFDVTAGYSYQEFYREQVGYFGFNLATDQFGVNDPAQAETLNPIAPSAVTNKLESVFGRVNLKYDDKYLLTANIRRDGSTRFGEANRFGVFPSLALGWRILDEDFASGLTSVLSNLKLRAGWGKIGNQDFDDFLYEQTYGFSETDASYQFGDDYVLLIRPTAVDPDIKWEETTTTNIGLDFGFLNNRITGALEFYDKYTTDLIFFANVIASTNVGDRVFTNIGEMSNQGVELSLNTILADRNDFNWSVNLNAAYNKNEIIKLTNQNEGGVAFETGGISGDIGQNIQVLQEGFAINSFRTYKQKYNADGTPVVGSQIEMYEDINGDELINEKDLVVTGRPNADVTLGLTSNMTYKNFDLSFTLRSSLGNEVYNNTSSANGFYNRLTQFGFNNIHESTLKTNFNSPQLKSDYYLENGSFVRMDNITLGYNFSQLDFVQMRVYGTVQNAFTLTGYSGFNPDIPNGIDNNLRPLATNFIVGLNLTF
ncbi:SusC/RagA family TonB-linked outer membrane protein [Marivirga lumbricoides]|uniref:SusC/RagA family TonB-linked outer membrane protein n=1 Tax=Marivirga lumbricoides TaxID=1046115 RepID=A0ABQ1MS11_9BACT|nr:SusC/RagA family TonB-linked outer membrane protein [Marivirga lumbricoides]